MLPNPSSLRSPKRQKVNDILTSNLDFMGGVRPTPKIITYKPLKPLNVQPFAFPDFETFYTSKYSLSNMSTWQYVNHPAFDAYLVSILLATNPEQWTIWIGHPIDAPWGDFVHLPWVSHNAGFDDLVHQKLISLDKIPRLRPPRWDCTQDLAKYLQVPGSLKGAVATLLGMDVDKSNRANMIGMRSADEATIKMAGEDSMWGAELWNRYSQHWPQGERDTLDEQFLSRETRKQGWRGVAIDKPKVESDSQKLKYEMHKMQMTIPWAKKGQTVYSHVKLKNHCYRIGIHPPPNLSLDDPETKKWHEQFKSKYPWVQTLKDYTICKQRLSYFELLLERCRKDNTVPFNLKYGGAQPTFRWQSEEDMRMQNLAKDEHFGVKERDKLIPRKGYQFAIVDSSQIEPRVLNWLVGNEEFLRRCTQGMSPYEAFARASGGYTKPGSLKKVSPALYALYKAQVLALGYQAAAEKYVAMAETQAGLKVFVTRPAMVGTKLDTWEVAAYDKEVAAGRLDPNNYTLIPSGIDTVDKFRADNPLISSYSIGIWKRLERAMEKDIGRHHFVQLPSGRTMRYYNVHRSSDGNMMATVVLNSPIPFHTKDWYGGKLTENQVQAISRDILAWFVVQIIRNLPDCRVIWTVHDEIITEVPDAVADERLKQILQIMHTTPDWARGLPVAAEGSLEPCYTK